MNKFSSRSEVKLKVASQLVIQSRLPSLSSREIVPSKPKTDRTPVLSSPAIQKSAKNLLLMRKIKPLGDIDSDSDEDSINVLKRLQSGKKEKPQPALTMLSKNYDKKTYLKQPIIAESLVGEEAISKFYERYKKLQRRKEQEDFMNEKHALTSIVNLLQMHNFTPRKLTLVKMKGQEAILDLRKLGIGQGSLGPVVSQILMELHHFQEIDFSYNRIDSTMSEAIVEKLGRVRKVNLSHNRISKVGCQQFSRLFLDESTILQEVNLQENSLLDNAGLALMEHMPSYSNLKVLNLNKNYLGVNFAESLKSFLRSGDKQLQELYLSWNEFSAKAVRLIFEGLSEHSYLKVFDFSWNKIDNDNAKLLAKVFEQAENLIHVDFSFCQINLSSIATLAKALEGNHTLYGAHFEGNSGFIDHKGFLIPTEKEYSEFPLPIIKGVIRQICGVKPNPARQFKESTNRDVCWICHSWQQRYFSLSFSEQMQEQVNKLNSTEVQCFIHFKFQQYRAVKMFRSGDGAKFQIERMCPIGQVQFFFTFSPSPGTRYTTTSSEYKAIASEAKIRYFMGKVQMQKIIKQRNACYLPYEFDPIDEYYEPNIDLLPRSSDSEVSCLQIQMKKHRRKVIRQQKVQVNFKDLDHQDDDFLKDKANRDDDQDYLRKCIEFDVANSKIPKLIKDETLMTQFKFMMTKYYKHFKDAFYYLSRSNPSAAGIFSISQLDFMGFLDQQKYITKRVNHAKIMLKLYACLSLAEEDSLKKVQPNKRQQEKINKLISRPQFLEFLVRLAIEKWCSFNPNKNKKTLVDKEKKMEEEEYKLLSHKKNNSNVGRSLKLEKIQKINSRTQRESTKLQMSPIGNLKNKSTPPQLKIQQVSPVLQRQQDEEVSEEQQELKKCKLELPLPLIEGIERTMRTLSRYAQNYNSWSWRRLKYLKIDILIVLKAYEQFLNALYEKYTNSKYFKTGKPKKLTNLMTLDEIKTLFLDTDIRKTKQAMKQVEQAFLDSKRLSIEDGNIQYGLNFDEFLECLARMAELIWFNPASAPHASIWDSQVNRKNTPLFLRFESFIIALYWRSPDLHNRRMTKIVDKGIFQLQINLLMQKIDARSKSSGILGLRRRNSILDQQEDAITLRKIIQELREYYDSMVIRREYDEPVEEISM